MTCDLRPVTCDQWPVSSKRKLSFNNGGKRRKFNPTKVLISAMRQLTQKTASLSERRIAAHTTRKTVNRLACKQLHLNLCSVRTTKRRNKPYVTWETKAQLDSCKKHKIFSRQTCTSLETKNMYIAIYRNELKQCINTWQIYTEMSNLTNKLLPFIGYV